MIALGFLPHLNLLSK